MSGVGRQRVWGVGLSAMTGDTHDVMCSAIAMLSADAILGRLEDRRTNFERLSMVMASILSI